MICGCSMLTRAVAERVARSSPVKVLTKWLVTGLGQNMDEVIKGEEMPHLPRLPKRLLGTEVPDNDSDSPKRYIVRCCCGIGDWGLVE